MEALDEEAAEALLFDDALAAEQTRVNAIAKSEASASRTSKGRVKKTGVPDAREGSAAAKTNSATAEAAPASTNASVKPVAKKSALRKTGKA